MKYIVYISNQTEVNVGTAIECETYVFSGDLVVCFIGQDKVAEINFKYFMYAKKV